MEERKHKRSHEEVVAAREAYLEKRKAKQEARLEKAKIRAERKAAREARKAMTPEERKAERQKDKIAAAKGRIKLEKEKPLYEPYKGNVDIGDLVVAIFAGCPVRGNIVSISKDTADVETGEEGEYQFRKGAASVKLYDVKSMDDGLIYPVRREKIVAKKESSK